MARRWHTAALAALAALALACEGAAGGRPTDPDRPGDRPGAALPSSIVALGDSVTAGYAACAVVVRCRHVSWSTGTAATVDSHYRRLLRANARIRDNRDNVAVPGARAAGLRAQADAAVRTGARYVTVLIGANDACRASVEAMTEPRTFRAQVDAALDRLSAGLPRATVLVVSVPDLYRLWEIGHDDDRAVRAWERGICPALLAAPRSTARADAARRRAVDRRVDAYNRELAAACRAYGRRCRYDGGAAHRVRFTLDMLSRYDWFHPNAAGQRRLSAATYPRAWQ
jgi:lysophospholipase L1-like esterase